MYGFTIAIYGGSFDPPHMGHAITIQWILWAGLADSVWVMPSAKHAFNKDSQPYEVRLGLCRAMAKHFGDLGVQVCDIEGKLAAQTEGPIFTYDVLDHLRKDMATRAATFNLRLVVGSDVLQEAHRWHRWNDIMAEFNPIIVGRQGYPFDGDAPTMPGYSSTELRRRIAANKDWESWVLPQVRKMLPGPYAK